MEILNCEKQTGKARTINWKLYKICFQQGYITPGEWECQAPHNFLTNYGTFA